MKLTDNNVIRFHLQVLYGITANSLERKRERLSVSGAKVFGVPLENVPRRLIPEFGLIPSFLVEACSFLLEHAGTVGLFRKPGSLPRIRTLRAKLNKGDECLAAALPYDVATLIKQFCRELPEPLFPPELHQALLQAQALPNERDRTSAVQLLSCLLPARSCSSLHYLFDFLSKVSQRCTENLMTCSNLATVFAPCLLPPPNKTEMSEGRLELRVSLLQTFITIPHLFGVIPQSVMDSMGFLMDFQFPQQPHLKKGHKKRHSFKVLRSVKTVSRIQGRSKVAPPASEQSQRATSAAKPTLRRSLGLETFPSIVMFRTYMPRADQGFSPAATSGDGSSPSRLRRDLCLGHVPRWIRGSDGARSPVLTAVGKLPITPWKRRSSL